MLRQPAPLTAGATVAARGYHPRMLLELLRLVAWLAVVITGVSLIALVLTQARL